MSAPDAVRTPAAAAQLDPESPWAGAIAVTALVTLVVGLLLSLLPNGTGYGESFDLSRALLGAAVVGVAGTLLAAWLFLCGIGWYLRRR